MVLMDLSVLRIHGTRGLGILAGLACFAGTMHATNVLTATPSTVTISCNTATGPGTAATVTIKSATTLATGSTIAVSVGSLSGGLVVTAPALTTLSTANQS